MQVTSSHVSIWFDFLASYDEYTALVKFGNVASEHVKSAISVVQPQLSAAQQKPSAVQQNRVGALVTHHPAWMSHHTGGSRQGHPRYTGAQQWEGRGWPDQEISQSAAHRYTKMQKLFNIILKKKNLHVSACTANAGCSQMYLVPLVCTKFNPPTLSAFRPMSILMIDDLDRLAEVKWNSVRFRTWLKHQGITKPEDLGIGTAAEHLLRQSSSKQRCGQSLNSRTKWP